METKKENPPHKSNVPLASLIAILTGLTSLVIFLTGKSSLPDLIKGEPPTATSTPTVTIPDNPLMVLSPTPSETNIPEAPPTKAFIRLTARPPEDSELETIPSLWTLTSFKELAEPGVNSYSVEVTQDSQWVWDCYFCTKNENFRDFMDSITLEFRIHEAPLEESLLRIFDTPGIKGWLCRNWSTVLSDWPAGRSVFLEIHFTHSRAVSDGRADFAAGEYSQLLVVVVKG